MRRAFVLLLLFLTGAGFTTAGPHGGPAVASFPGANGRLVYVSDRDQRPTDIYVMEGDGSGEAQLTNTLVQERHPAWSPDGEQVAFMSERDGNQEIYVMEADGSNVRRLTDEPAFDDDAAWSPDGSRIAFTTGRDPAGPSIYVMNADGSDPVQLVPPEGQSICCLDWSPNGRTLAYAVGIPSQIVLFDIDGEGSMVLVTGGARDPSWSPDGRRIAYVLSNAASGSNIYLASLDPPGTPQRLTAGDATDRYPAWSPDGSTIAFARNVRVGGEHFQIHIISADGGEDTQLTSNDFDDWELDWQALSSAGDANCDGVKNSLDAAIVLQYAAGLLDDLPCLTSADANGDGRVDAIDAALILQYDAGLLDEL